MSHASTRLARCALALALFGSAAVAQAAEITILYTGSGERSGVPGGWIGKADDWGGLSSLIPGDWDVTRAEVYDPPARSFSGTFTWDDTGPGNNSLYGRFVGGWEAYGDMTHVRVFNNFVIEGGTGIFKGATGSGEDRVYTNFVVGHYVESGILKVTTPVPEPATALLLAGGLAGMAALRRRRD